MSYFYCYKLQEQNVSPVLRMLGFTISSLNPCENLEHIEQEKKWLAFLFIKRQASELSDTAHLQQLVSIFILLKHT